MGYAVQPAESLLMKRNPRHPRHEKMVNGGVLMYSYGWIGQLQMIFCWMMFFAAGPGIWQIYSSSLDPADYTSTDRLHDKQGMSVYYWTLVLGQIAAPSPRQPRVRQCLALEVALTGSRT